MSATYFLYTVATLDDRRPITALPSSPRPPPASPAASSPRQSPTAPTSSPPQTHHAAAPTPHPPPSAGRRSRPPSPGTHSAARPASPCPATQDASSPPPAHSSPPTESPRVPVPRPAPCPAGPQTPASRPQPEASRLETAGRPSAPPPHTLPAATALHPAQAPAPATALPHSRSALPSESPLNLRRKIRQLQKRQVILLHERPILLRLRLQRHPLRIGLERSPVRIRLRPALMPEDVHKRPPRQRLIRRHPERHRRHPMPLQQRPLLASKPFHDHRLLALIQVIDPQLIHALIARTLRLSASARLCHTHRHRRQPNHQLSPIHISPPRSIVRHKS